jgi:hypothetical protein
MNIYYLKIKSKVVIMGKIGVNEVKNNNKSYEENVVVLRWK